ncbi:Succinyl-CoA ligase [GDP-forming] subunit beta, mitochondrial [Liparis tanakae]|uniref:Succinyl-CoA ligase [GDP-forming] subunit beta, mitochondrial n=1 Tax=Liparis tanakae TaxID=230148 RepID=A0A4Z2ECB6_9TELE|nr:Succinyl-CoA ligase [GDP-forming] subunit beta, mitochondrial [Liparis tanakae]
MSSRVQVSSRRLPHSEAWSVRRVSISVSEQRVNPFILLLISPLYLSSSLSPPCRVQVMVAEALDITRETYFAILMDRACNGPVMVGSPQGGMDIEEVAASSPELIFKTLSKKLVL